MKILLGLFLFLSLGLNRIQAQESSNKPLKDLKLYNLEGEPVNLKDQVKKGQITFISFWATWCAPCKKELDNLKKYYPKWQEEYDLHIIAISLDNPKMSSRVNSTVAEKEWEYTILSDPEESAYDILGFQSVPQSFLIDASGNIVESHAGYEEGDEEKLAEKIKALYNK